MDHRRPQVVQSLCVRACVGVCVCVGTWPAISGKAVVGLKSRYEGFGLLGGQVFLYAMFQHGCLPFFAAATRGQYTVSWSQGGVCCALVGNRSVIGQNNSWPRPWAIGWKRGNMTIYEMHGFPPAAG